MIFNFLPLIHKYKKIKKIVEEKYRARERERESPKPPFTRGPPEYLETVLMICPGP